MKIVCTIEARMTSTRLPGKVLMEAGNKTMLQILVERLKKVKLIDEIVLATTINKADDELVDHSKFLGINFYRGSEEDVMGRVIEAADSVNGELIVEITGDCPLIDYEIVEQIINTYLCNDADYVGNSHIRSYPDGMDVQVFKLETLKESAKMTNDPLDREHVTLHIRNNKEIFRQINCYAPPDLYWPELGLTLDEYNDYQLLKNIIENFHERIDVVSCQEIINYLKLHKELIDINRNVQRKGDT